MFARRLPEWMENFFEEKNHKKRSTRDGAPDGVSFDSSRKKNRVETSVEFLIEIGYQEKEDKLYHAHRELGYELAHAMDDAFDPLKDILQKSSSLKERFLHFSEYLQDYKECLEQIDDLELRRSKMELMHAELNLTETVFISFINYMDLLKNISILVKTHSRMEQEQLSDLMEQWIDPCESPNLFQEVLYFISGREQDMINDRSVKQTIEQHLPGLTTILKRIGFGDKYKNKLDTLMQKDFSIPEKLRDKALEIDNAFMVRLCFIKAQRRASELYCNYFERHGLSLEQKILKMKKEFDDLLINKRVVVSKASQAGMFSSEMKKDLPITTWKRNPHTEIQAIFLNRLTNSEAIRSSLKSLKKGHNFNISCFEYLDNNGNYKILFAISGSNGALSSDCYTAGGRSVNKLITQFVRDWNDNNRGIIFEYVTSYNEEHLQMNTLEWFCSEPKIAIEKSKIKPHNCFGQNNWKIIPNEGYRIKEHSACERHCQPRKDQLLNFEDPGSPLRTTS